MKFIDATTPAGQKSLTVWDRRAEPKDAVRDSVAKVMAAVRAQGDAAVLQYTAQFDKAKLTAGKLAVPMAECVAAWKKLPLKTRRLIADAHENVAAFAKAGLRQDWSRKNAQGALVGEMYRGFDRVGLYVPGGTAPLISSVIMTVTLAKVAGCSEIVVCTPCGPDGKVHSALMAALYYAGATEVYRIGGIQAIAAMTYGTATIKPVVKIFGPGNQWVIEAKRQAFGRVAIDQLPGPSEVMVLADETGNPAWIAADLIAQAEHGHGSEAVLVSPSRTLLDAVKAEVEKQVQTLSRQEFLRENLDQHGALILTQDIKQAVLVANAYASEHLTLIVKDPTQWIRRITTSGAIFVGNHSPVAVGDYLAGPSHTLPTGGAGKSFAGLTVDQFQRRTGVVTLDAESMAASAPLVSAFAQLEGLDAHARSATIRLSRKAGSSAAPASQPKAKSTKATARKSAKRPLRTS